MANQPSLIPGETQRLNETLRLIHSHGSVRKYKPDPLELEMIQAIVAAGQRASTSSNLQSFSVVAVTQAEKRARLAELCGNQAHVAEAQLFLVWCADLYRLDRACQLRGYTQVASFVENFLVAVIDASIAAQNAALAAESFGLGIWATSIVSTYSPHWRGSRCASRSSATPSSSEAA